MLWCASHWSEKQQGWRRTIYRLHGDEWTRLDSGYVLAPSIRHLGTAFDRNFALTWQSIAYSRKGGRIELELSGDDVLEIQIDGTTVARRDPQVGMGTTIVPLEIARGTHAISVRYEQRGGGRQMHLVWRAARPSEPGPTASIEFYRPGNAAMVRAFLPSLGFAMVLATVLLGAATPLSARSWVLPSLVGLSAVQRLWFATAQLRTALRSRLSDDFLFVRLADQINSGNWLGPFDRTTLVKHPGYPIWIGINSFLPGSLRVADELLYCAACLAIYVALRPLMPQKPRALLCIALLWVPASFHVARLQYLREAIYPAATLTVLAMAIGYVARPAHRPSVRLTWAAALGIAIGGFWVVREESVWIVPFLAVTLGWSAFRDHRHRTNSAAATAMALSVIAIGAVGIPGAMVLQNHYRYGVLMITDQSRAEVGHALGALRRVDPERTLRRAPVRREALQAAYAVSPTLASLRPFLEQRMREYVDHGKTPEELASPEYQGQVLGGWFHWVVREAIEDAGHYRDAASTLSIYRQIGIEIDAACAAGQLPCGSPNTSAVPSWRWRDTSEFSRAVARSLAILLVQPVPRLIANPSLGDAAAMRWFEKISNDHLAPANNRIRRTRGSWRVDSIAIIIWLWRPAFWVSVAAMFVIAGVRSVRSINSTLLVISLGILAATGMRVAILSFMATRFFWTILTPLYIGTLVHTSVLGVALAALALTASSNRPSAPGN